MYYDIVGISDTDMLMSTHFNKLLHNKSLFVKVFGYYFYLQYYNIMSRQFWWLWDSFTSVHSLVYDNMSPLLCHF